jgi:hypothetical protein
MSFPSSQRTQVAPENANNGLIMGVFVKIVFTGAPAFPFASNGVAVNVYDDDAKTPPVIVVLVPGLATVVGSVAIGGLESILTLEY